MNWTAQPGATYLGNDRCRFRVWAPLAQRVEVHLLDPPARLIPLHAEERGYHAAVVDKAAPGSRYRYRLDGERERPDPASHFQPEGVHGPSQIVDHAFPWEDAGWSGITLDNSLFYELHIGTFTAEGTFDAAAARLEELVDLGVTNLEIMPVAQFPGDRNWGYDGVYPFAVQDSYGGPRGLKRFVNRCHQRGVAVTLDVVYNHLGPEGNYLRSFGPYFTARYRTPWGEAVNFDGSHSDAVRDYFVHNALFWLHFYHIDCLRLDAVHAIYDQSAVPFLHELAERIEAFSARDGRRRLLIAESDLNDSRLVRPRTNCGYGLDAQWCDDFHHALHVLLTGEQQGYYADFGTSEHLVKAINQGFVYCGQYSAYRQRRHGNESADLPSRQWVVAAQNHDQIGNRMFGERLSRLISFEAQKLAAAVVLLAPTTPLLFMGEEYGELAPFLYFVSHTDPALIEAVRAGRKEEFRDFAWSKDPPDPAARETFLESKLQWHNRNHGRQHILLGFYKHLIRLRCRQPASATGGRSDCDAAAVVAERVVALRRRSETSEMIAYCNFNRHSVLLEPQALPRGETWQLILDSAAAIWGGPGSTALKNFRKNESLPISPEGVVVYLQQADRASNSILKSTPWSTA